MSENTKKTYRIYALMTASKFLGEFEAESEAEAREMAEDQADFHVSICHQCSRQIEIGDVHDVDCEEVS